MRVDGPDEVSAAADDVLTWHAQRVGDDGTLHAGSDRTLAVVVAVVAAGALGVVFLRRRA